MLQFVPPVSNYDARCEYLLRDVTYAPLSVILLVTLFEPVSQR